jgi:hypothetical protein
MKLSKATKIVANDGQITFNRHFGSVIITDSDDTVTVEPGRDGSEKLKNAFLGYISGFRYGDITEGIAFTDKILNMALEAREVLRERQEEEEAKLKAEAPVLTLVTDEEGA